ncbi:MULTISPECIES: HesB/YadR/YfhF family protein [Carnobacterium]|uniref:HesB/YadR/YfhF family protein n=1 Tax=Carnobacterium divergens TaxID=2748 RepID=A0A2R8A0Y4_CARDV|nr:MULTISPECIES: HesB/YadR/YfhF family protein [Carnobacterium]MCO6017553.1 HesB/YadR/YfhF family protein [Carnobacterium divergens]MDT1939079.1 hypothetical protein [Carnobacterium divergens]MDT1941517.1 hypothetical protein [Carnobacterium divergens]MDT1947315.1 hypothetical protein [Carnobacterium divergens]MDT1949754.1 hypothetical protein [Carnobacterium divergens]
MKIEITDTAKKWFEDEVGVSNGAFVRFFGKYGGTSPIQQGFSLGIELVEPRNPLGSTEKEGVTYFVEDGDEWYFSGHDLKVDYDESKDEPIYEYL